MKKILIVLVVMTSLLLVTTTGTLAAQDFKFIGGLTYTTLDLSNLNSEFDKANQNLKNAEQAGYQVNYYDNIDDASGFYLGVQTDYNDQIKLNGQYERFSFDSDASLSQNGQLIESKSFDFKVNSLVGVASYEINDVFSFDGGIGYYFGESTFDSYDANSPNDPTETYTDTVDINGLGFKLGTNVNYELNSNWSIIGNAKYRFLTMDTQNSNDELDLDGFELSGGVLYSF